MGTRGIIARPTPGDGFEGRYHHWDSYPTGLGATLYRLANEHFANDYREMVTTLIDDHPAGWSTINACNFDLEPGFGDAQVAEILTPTGERDWHAMDTARRRIQQPRCYCHGERSEEASPLVTHDGQDGGAEYAYVIDPDSGNMAVLEKFYADSSHATGWFGVSQGDAHWTILGLVPLGGPEPDWKLIECGPNFERCRHLASAHFPEATDGISMAQWFGKEPLSPEQAESVTMPDGRRVELTMSGQGDGKAWWTFTKDGEKILTAFYVGKTGEKRENPALTYHYPPIAAATA